MNLPILFSLFVSLPVFGASTNAADPSSIVIIPADDMGFGEDQYLSSEQKNDAKIVVDNGKIEWWIDHLECLPHKEKSPSF